jgi:peptidylprolyl isomerase
MPIVAPVFVLLLLQSKGLAKLTITDVSIGRGQRAVSGDTVWVNYTGRLKNGKVFDTSLKPEAGPFAFVLGAGQVIKGWDAGVAGMKVGGKRKLGIPYNMAYGERAMGPIPAKSDLYFDVSLLAVIKRGNERVLVKKDTKIGRGAKVVDGSTVTMHYVGHLINGKKFDSSRDSGRPFSFRVGAGQVIAGFEQGVLGMKVGGKRQITVPPALGYGEAPMPGLPGNSILIFDIEILKVK